jgi:diguanylate cyclase (GGDEF)-like protein
MEEQVRHLAHYDALTDLPNRTLFSDRLHQALVIAKRDKTHLAVMFIDLDKFKPVNDLLGHDVGDWLLKKVAQRIQECLRESDTVARIGGDEFIVLLPSIETDQDAFLVAEKIRSSLNLPFVLADDQLEISSSIGISVYPEHGAEDKELIKNADVAMYYAKFAGRDNVKIFRPDMPQLNT